MTLEDTKGADPQSELFEIRVSLEEAREQRWFKDLFLPGIRGVNCLLVWASLFCSNWSV